MVLPSMRKSDSKRKIIPAWQTSVGVSLNKSENCRKESTSFEIRAILVGGVHPCSLLVHQGGPEMTGISQKSRPRDEK